VKVGCNSDRGGRGEGLRVEFERRGLRGQEMKD